NPLFRRPVAENPALLVVFASHKTKTFIIVSGYQSSRIFPQPAKRKSTVYLIREWRKNFRTTFNEKILLRRIVGP
ncbi:MAG: hypothetical protein ACLPWF_03795, partial [Bryobacteraceae bacterium]